MEEKIARICYNNHEWTRPSGPEGKGTLEKSFEHIHGFGHEEWLLDETRLINGYHYGFLQPMSSFRYAGKTFDVHLFYYDKKSGKKYLGVIHNVECIDREEARRVYVEYKEQGWIDQMIKDIQEAKGDSKVLENSRYELFNIRFHIKDIDVNHSNPRIISKDDPNTRATYYKLFTKKTDFVFTDVPDTKRRSGRKAVPSKSENKVFVHTDPRETSYDPHHNIIQNRVKEILDKSGLYDFIKLENNYVDITAVTPSGENHYYEVKTSSAKRSIREALGQVMEYAYYPNVTDADKLIIVAPQKADSLDREYLETLRNRFGIPVWFQYYSFEDNTLSNLM